MLNRILFLLLTGSSFFPLYSHSAIYLDYAEMPNLILETGKKNGIPYKFTVHYRVPCLSGGDCENTYKTEKHRIGISGILIGETEDGKYDHLMPDLKNGKDNLNPYIYSNDNHVKGSGTKHDRLHFDLGDWPDEKRPDNSRVSATFEVIFKAKVAELNEFCFYIVGEDTDGDYYRDSLYVCLSIETKDLVKISGLTDISLTGSNPTAESSACLYSTSGIVDLSFDSLNTNTNEKFKLLNDSEEIFYKFAIKSSLDQNWEEHETEKNHSAPYIWNANNVDENCHHKNNIDFKITAEGINNGLSGTYTDTMTVTIAPK